MSRNHPLRIKGCSILIKERMDGATIKSSWDHCIWCFKKLYQYRLPQNELTGLKKVRSYSKFNFIIRKNNIQHLILSLTFWPYYVLKVIWSKCLLLRTIHIGCPWCNGYRCKEIDTAIRVQIVDEDDCISYCTNTFEKGMNPIILLPAMSK